MSGRPGDGPAGPVTVQIVRTGLANLASVAAGLARAGADPQLTEDPRAVAEAEAVVLPGVGSFAPAMARLAELGLVEPLRRRIADGRPTLAVCLGLQLLLAGSEESPESAGLGILPLTAGRFRTADRVPQLGWNRVAAGAGCAVLGSGHAYFANSYRLAADGLGSDPGDGPGDGPGDDTDPAVAQRALAARLADAGFAAAWCRYGEPFVAACERGAVVACQFHPELSGGFGLGILERWLAAVRRWRAGDPAERAAAGGQPPAPPDLGAAGLTRRVIPCLDVKDGRVVKGVRFQGLRDAGDPVERAAAYEAQGADELVVLDVSATPEGRKTAIETVRQVRRQLSIPLTVGGGIRTAEDAAELLAAGADKVAVNTAAVARPELLSELARRFGVQCTVLALDAGRPEVGPADGGDDLPSGYQVIVRSGTRRERLDAAAWAAEAVARGAGEILLTSWDRDGTREGYDLELTRAVRAAVTVPVIASGGADRPRHLAEALAAGADAVLAASIFHHGDYRVDDVKRILLDQGLPMRPPAASAAGLQEVAS